MLVLTKKRRGGYIALSVGIILGLDPALNIVENDFISSFFSGSLDRALKL